MPCVVGYVYDEIDCVLVTVAKGFHERTARIKHCNLVVGKISEYSVS